MWRRLFGWAGLLMLIAGVVWTLQGFGLIRGSVMTGVTLWAVVGPVVALGGLALMMAGLWRRNLRSCARSAFGRPPDHSSVDRRRRFTCDRCRLAVNLRSLEPRVGFVGRRGSGGGAVAVVSNVVRRSIAASRLRSCERCSEALTVMTPSTSLPASARSARSLRTGPRAEDAARL